MEIFRIMNCCSGQEYPPFGKPDRRSPLAFLLRAIAFVGFGLFSLLPIHAGGFSAPSETVASDPDADADSDGLSNAQEAERNSSPNAVDTDGDGVEDIGDAVANNPAMKVPAAPESGYAIVDLGSGVTPVGLNDSAEVLLLEPPDGDGLRVGKLWREGALVSVGTGKNFRGPLQDGSVYFAGDVEEGSDSDLYGTRAWTHRNTMIWNFAWGPDAFPVGIFEEDTTWTGTFPVPLPTTPPPSEILLGAMAASYNSVWSQRLGEINAGINAPSAFPSTTRMRTTLGTFSDAHKTTFDMTLEAAARVAQRPDPDTTNELNLEIRVEEVGHIAPLGGGGNFFAGFAAFGWNDDIPDYDASRKDLWKNLQVSADLYAIGLLDSVPVVVLQPTGFLEAPIPNATNLTDLSRKTSSEGPYILGTSGGKPTIWCFNSGQIKSQTIAGVLEPPGEDGKVVSRKISNNLVVPARAGIWKNGGFRPMSKLNPSADALYSGWRLKYVSPAKNYIVGTAISRTDGAEHAVLLVPLDIAVDANRNSEVQMGFSTDTTTQEKPFVFWVNDDFDEDNKDEVSGTPDWNDGLIQCARDLEDFSRIKISVSGLREAFQQGKFKIGFEWKQTTGSPAVQVYPQVEESAGEGYLKDEQTAAAQIVPGVPTGRWALVAEDSCTLIGTGQAKVFAAMPNSIATRDFESDGMIHLLFEGCGEGKGQLCITIHDENGAKIGDGPGVWLDLKNIKKMYVRAKGTPENGIDAPFESYFTQPNPPPTAYVDDPNGQPFQEPCDEADSLIVYVHGIHAPFTAVLDAYMGNILAAEVVFKRLWHQGFKGRFAFYKWPALNPAGFGSTGFEFNGSEYRAWKYGRGLAQFVNSINKTSKNLFAHSQGNIVCGAALTDYGLSVDNYVLTQAAVPAGCYDTSGGQSDPNSINGYARFWNREVSKPTPDFACDLGYRGYLQIHGVSGNVKNFHNFDDYALASGRTFLLFETHWEANQDSYKPDSSASNANAYTYFPGNPTGQRCQLVDALFAGRFVTDSHEAMSMIARPRSKAAGALGATRGVIGSDFDLSAMRDSTGQQVFTRSGDDHGAQVGRRIQEIWPYYTELGDAFGVLSVR